MNELSDHGESRQSPEEKRREKINKNTRELARRKEAGELAEIDFGPEGIYYLQQEGNPLTRSAVGDRAVVLSQEQFDTLGYIELVFENGEITIMDSEVTGYKPDDLLIIFPEELGDVAGE